MKKILILTLAATLAGCSTMGEQVMPPVQYKQPIATHVNKTAYINWEMGKVNSAEVSSTAANDPEIIGMLIMMGVEHAERSQSPGQYNVSYGKAQQVVFITSLRDVLEQNHVFKRTQITTDPNKVSAKDVLITVNFKSTRVAYTPPQTDKMFLDVELKISEAGKPVFKKTYFIESEQFWETGLAFKQEQTKVSQELLGKIISAIEDWNKQTLHG